VPPIWIDDIGNERPSWIDPLMRSRWAPQGGTIKFIPPARETPDLNLPALEFSLANAANTLIVERIPSPESILPA